MKLGPQLVSLCLLLELVKQLPVPGLQSETCTEVVFLWSTQCPGTFGNFLRLEWWSAKLVSHNEFIWEQTEDLLHMGSYYILDMPLPPIIPKLCKKSPENMGAACYKCDESSHTTGRPNWA
ncbi:uncharacterized protein PGTG_05374 [Puccinia graminis f. sp. tritici CRL 75-36-700-3]|uniref:Uncharacterized protein n=1 Tax=Puccinia graminis f. sp. tritici (strain CRL 75-36-700-3 / race SCCL) TaxID=418459 RepID=E3K6I9_PUCGT|nr:uncharacterized protein PGTG_05374 [Puccinia graminis f. sp. tritici CRL 75-36-700-3]EFP80149.1 hypothetical protein PGTG_05374 [Puccinia graminis f. sp. tritici CRL 75-36-700-3]